MVTYGMKLNGKTVLVTGGAGFIGSCFVKLLLNEVRNCKVINLDKLTYAGNLENLEDVRIKYESTGKYRFIKGDICDFDFITGLFAENTIDMVVNFAAQSHVDRSIDEPGEFVTTNVLGTQQLLDVARKNNIGCFLQISTDEVYGSLGEEGSFTENTPIAPNSPYSASKASADLICRGYYKTYNMPVLITRCSNNYGPFQFPEKLIPLVVQRAYENKSIPVYGKGLNVRDWIYVEDHCRALKLVLEKGIFGEVYNIGGNEEHSNIVLVQEILKIMGKPLSLIEYVKDRPGHDLRYAVNASKIKNELGWEPLADFKKELECTIDWYLENRNWVNNVLNNDYMKYYEKMYGER